MYTHANTHAHTRTHTRTHTHTHTPLAFVKIVGHVLGTTLRLIAWLKEEGDDIGIARRVVEAVWPRVCPGRASPSRLDKVV
jgi:hypothetical protein